MVRAPCSKKMGLKKGPWTPEEDGKLTAYIRNHGHGNWQQLPKQAGLLRCGKSCRLRWVNYLKPDIKRGKFSLEEEETIIKLHKTLGNRWSAIAERLPGRTDNEIKNIWNIYLKKRLKQNPVASGIEGHPTEASISVTTSSTETSENPNMESNGNFQVEVGSQEIFPAYMSDSWLQMPPSPVYLVDQLYTHYPYNDDSGDFWSNALMEVGELPDIWC